MSEHPVRILHLEDDDNDALLVSSLLEAGGLSVDITRVQTKEELDAALAKGGFDLIISDYSGPQFDGKSSLALAKSRAAEVPFVFVSGTMGEEVAVESLLDGATDYVLKSGKMSRLVPAVERALRDVRERLEKRRLEEQFRQAQKMEAIGRLAGGVAHDFNNILTAIIGLAQLSARELPSDSAVRSDLDEIAATALRAADLTRQLLAFSRKQIVRPKVVSLNDLLTNIEKMLKRIIGENVHIVFQPAADLAPVRVDPGQMDQLIVNLAVNARDAMPQGGRLTLETANERLDEAFAAENPGASTGEFVALRVADTGIGMTEDSKARIFEPFFTTKGHGTGLGLATCYGIVKQNGGYIKVETAPGKGSVFSVYLPRAQGAAESFDRRVPESASLDGAETILVLEDDAGVRNLTCRILSARRYAVLEARSLDEALRVIDADKERKVRMMITDVVMPQAGGKECAEAIAARRPDIKVLFASGYSDEAISHQGILDAGIDFIPKPFTSEQLARKVRQVLDAA